MSDKKVFYLPALEILTIPRGYGHTVRINGHGINASDDEVGLLHFSGSARSAWR